ncbi:MAG: alpha/beta hydrolase [Eubacteriales bacterium]|jgi:acetyl esterase/lipase
MHYLKMSMEELNPRLPAHTYPANLQCYLRDDLQPGAKVPLVLTMPGGGYSCCAPHEGDPISFQYLAAGYHAMTLNYSCAPDRYPTALLQVTASILWAREHADEYGIGKVFVCGFSAGGHLTASSGILWKDPVLSETLGVDAKLLRPDGMILGYPVLIWGELTHKGSFYNLLGQNLPEETYAKFSLEKRVDNDTCPAFLWHTFADSGVPVENSLRLADALRAHKIPFELHIYPKGGHGLGLALGDPHVASWMKLACQWIALV